MTSRSTESVPSAGAIAEVVRLVGDRVVVLHAPSEEGLSGRDVDCAVTGLDRWWPLRLDPVWRLCQFSQYDLRGWAWVLERRGEAVHLDTLDDPRGVGRDAFPTAAVDLGSPSVSRPREAPVRIRAAYLAMKRIRKGDRGQAEWGRIRDLASEDWLGFGSSLHQLAGERLGSLLHRIVREGRAPHAGELARARTLQTLRRFRTPRRAAEALVLQVGRVIDRLVNPTGWSILIVGPDGTGKSTHATSLGENLAAFFRKTAAGHWRPGILPRPGAVLGRGEPDHTAPHSRPPHGSFASLSLLAYYWLDFFIGGLLQTWAVRLRTGLVLTERGWWDIAVDPRRYRLDVPSSLVRGLGALLQHPDLVVLLDAAPDVVLTRKPELSAFELARQRRAWRQNLPPNVPVIRIDTSRPASEITAQTRDAVLRAMHDRAVRRLGAGWTSLRHKGGIRWWIPRGPASVAAEALSIYQPVTTRGRLAWTAARLAAGLGGFGLSPRGEAPPPAVRHALAPYLAARETVAVARANHPGRYVAVIITGDGRRRAFAKVATDRAGVEALEKEAGAIRAYGPLLPFPLAAPRIIEARPGVLLLEAVVWRSRSRPWWIEPDLARALGVFYRRGVDGGTGGGLAHGDFAPWNLLEVNGGFVLLDWESARPAAPPFLDLCHFLIQSHTLLGQPTWEQLLSGFRAGRGWVGAAVRAYAEGADLSPDQAVEALESYLRSTAGSMEAEGERAGGRARRQLLRQLGR